MARLAHPLVRAPNARALAPLHPAALSPPSMGTTQPALVADAIKRGAKDAGPAGFDQYYGWGRVDAAATLKLVAGSAPAQKFTVPVCSGGVNRLFTPFAQPGWAAYQEACPASARGGLITRNAVGTATSTVLGGSGSMYSFTAPAGTNIARVFWAGRISAAGYEWTVGLGGSGITWYRGRRGAPTTSCPYAAANPYRYSSAGEWIPVNDTSFYQIAACATGTCNTSSTGVAPYYTRAEVDTDRADVEIKDVSPPVINVTSGLTGAVSTTLGPVDVVRGTVTVRYDANDATGIAAVGTAVNATPALTTRTCDYTTAVPCTNVVTTSTTVDTATLPNGYHYLAIRARDAAGNVSTNQRWFYVDNVA